jgi:hypothetical protein
MKIIMNGFPRSGTTNFTEGLRAAVRSLRSGNHKERITGQEWITNKNDALYFVPQYSDDIIVCYILREPELAIASNVERWLKGFTGKIVSGMVIVDHHQKKNVDDLTDDIKNFIDDQIEIFQTYLVAFKENKNNLEIIHYDQTRNDPINSIKNILDLSGVDITKIDNFQNSINFLKPTNPERTSAYFNILSYLKENENFKEVEKLYLECFEIMVDKQKLYPFKLNMGKGENNA